MLEPNNALFIAGAKVQFTASGVDAGGYAAEIPAGCKWALSDKAYGTIDASGLFQSNGTCGTVTVNLMRGDEVVGTTAIEVQEPDELYFALPLSEPLVQAVQRSGLDGKVQDPRHGAGRLCL